MDEIDEFNLTEIKSEKKQEKKSDTSKEVSNNYVSYEEFIKSVKKTRILPHSYKNSPHFDEISTEQQIEDIKLGKKKAQIDNKQTFDMYSGDISLDNAEKSNKSVSYEDFLRSVKKTRITPLSSEGLTNFGVRSFEQSLNDKKEGKKKVQIENEQFFDMYSGDIGVDNAEKSNKRVSYEDFIRNVKKTRITPLPSESLPNLDKKLPKHITKDGIEGKKKVKDNYENILGFKSNNKEKKSEKIEDTSKKLDNKTKKEPIRKSDVKIKEEKSKIEEEKKKEIHKPKENIREENEGSKKINQEKDKSEEKSKSDSIVVREKKKELTSEKQKSQNIKREGEKTDQKQKKEKEEEWHEISSKRTKEEREEQEGEKEKDLKEIINGETEEDKIWNDPETEGINSDMLKLNNESCGIESVRTEINKVEPLKESIKKEQNQEDLRNGLKLGLEEDISKHTGEGDFKNLEISKDFFYKVGQEFHCKDVESLKKIYDKLKSFPKVELYLKNQDCKNIPSSYTIRRLVQGSLKSKLEYNTLRHDFRLREVQEIAKERSGECLSTEYKGSLTKLKFRCKNGHEFEATPNGVKDKDSWCPTCAGVKKLTLKEFQDIAKERRGECLSTEYKNIITKLRFRCMNGHEFEAIPNDVKFKDSWCPICSERAGERVCRGLFESIFNKDFEKARPEWLKNSEGHQLELDGYNDELKLAFERQGEQHYEWPNYFHKTVKDFISQLSNDQQKEELCETHGVTLIEVPYWIKFEEYQDYIIKQCKKRGINVPQMKNQIDWKKFKWDTNDDSNRSLKEWI